MRAAAATGGPGFGVVRAARVRMTGTAPGGLVQGQEEGHPGQVRVPFGVEQLGADVAVVPAVETVGELDLHELLSEVEDSHERVWLSAGSTRPTERRAE